MSHKLTSKQKLFVKAYLKDLNATQAAIDAGYSEKTAGVIGNENLKKPYISTAIQKEMDKRADKFELTADNVLNDILETRKICSDNMMYTDSNDEYRVDTAALNGRNKTNELLGKHLKLFTDKVEHSGEINIPQISIKRG